jgi:hypothetical protein
MANVYLISDEYFTEQYPEYSSLDMGKFYSALLIEQQTSLESILGETLYAWLISNANTPLTGDKLKLLKQAQYILVFLTAKQLKLLNRKYSDASPRDQEVDAITGKISYLKQKLKTLINDSTDLASLQNNDATYNATQKHDWPVYFPR